MSLLVSRATWKAEKKNGVIKNVIEKKEQESKKKSEGKAE